MSANLFTSFFAFVATNIDDIFILMLFFGNRNVNRSKIVLGQYLGIATLVAISFLGAFIGNFVDQRYIGLLGFFPIYLAVKQTISRFRNQTELEGDDVTSRTTGFIAIAGVTIANGGDNLGVYIPLLTTMEYYEKVELIIVFAVMTYVWCMAAQHIASRPLIARQLDKYGHIIMPVVLFILGIFILIESNTLSLVS